MPYRVEYATSNRAKCKSSICGGTKITKGSLQFGSVVDFNGVPGLIGKHWGCVSPMTLENLKRRIGEISELDGYQDLNHEDKARLDAAFKDGHVADADITNSTKKPATAEAEDDDKEAGGIKQAQKVPAKTKIKKADVMNGDDEVDDLEKDIMAMPRKTSERTQQIEPKADDERLAKETELPSDPTNSIVFKGRTPGGISCEQFVRAVRTHSVAEKKARDNEYIADYAMSCFDGEALHWSETLPMEVQGDWTLLRRALLAEYGTSSYSPALSNALNPTLNATSISPFSDATAPGLLPSV